jgi:BASS family bile acid:Na+ symporter
MSTILLPVGLAFIMFSLGLGLGVDDFRRVARRPGVLAAGLFAQVIALPATALLIALAWRLPPTLAVGLMVLAACPGGVTAGMVTRLAGGDTALSISLTALTSLIAFLTVPVIVGGALWYFLGAAAEVRVPVGQLAGGLFTVTLVPVLTGLLLSGRGWVGPGTQRVVHRLATATFFLIVLWTFYSRWPVLSQNFGQVGGAALSLNLVTMLTGALLGVLLGVSVRARIALAMECGLQNAALGITLAVAMLRMPDLAVPSVVYALLMNLTALVVVASRPWLRKPARA